LSLKLVIIGGVAGGASAAVKARRTDEEAEITVFEKGLHVSFANCGLPYYVGEIISDRGELLLQTPEKFWKRFRVSVKVRHEVLAIKRDQKLVTVKCLETDEVLIHPYDKLILAPGAGVSHPIRECDSCHATGRNASPGSTNFWRANPSHRCGYR